MEVLKSRDLLAVFEDESIIRDMNPDFDKLKQIRDLFAVIVTARGETSDLYPAFSRPMPVSLKILLLVQPIAR